MLSPEVEQNFLWRMTRRSRQHYLGEDLISMIDALPVEQRDECVESLGNTSLSLQMQCLLENASDSSVWEDLALIILKGVSSGVASGELSLTEALQKIQGCTHGCTPQTQRAFLGMASEKLLLINPRILNKRRPPFGEWNIAVAVSLVRLFADREPQLSTCPKGKGETALTKARDTLRRLQLHRGYQKREVSVWTIHKWFLAASTRDGIARSRGRPVNSRVFNMAAISET